MVLFIEYRDLVKKGIMRHGVSLIQLLEKINSNRTDIYNGKSMYIL